jgi:hypothetical protein
VVVRGADQQTPRNCEAFAGGGEFGDERHSQDMENNLGGIAALLAGCLLLLVMVTRAWKGDLPSEISTQGLKYASVQATDDSAIALAELEAESVRARAERAELRSRIEALEKRH